MAVEYAGEGGNGGMKFWLITEVEVWHRCLWWAVERLCSEAALKGLCSSGVGGGVGHEGW